MTFSQEWLHQQERERNDRIAAERVTNGGPMIHRTNHGYALPSEQQAHGTENRTVDSVMVNRDELARLRTADETLKKLVAPRRPGKKGSKNA